MNANARSGALGVFAVAGQAHGHTWRCGIVAVDQCRPLEAADNGIEIAVVIKVAKRHAVAVVFVVKSPPGTNLLEARVAEITIGDVGRVEWREKEDRLPLLRDRDFAEPADLVLGVEVVGVELEPVGHEYVLPTIEVDIKENTAPGPLRRGHAGKVGGLRKGAVASTDVEAIAAALRLVCEVARSHRIARNGALLREAAAVISAEHLDNKKVVVTVAVDVGEVYTHRRKT